MSSIIKELENIINEVDKKYKIASIDESLDLSKYKIDIAREIKKLANEVRKSSFSKEEVNKIASLIKKFSKKVLK